MWMCFASTSRSCPWWASKVQYYYPPADLPPSLRRMRSLNPRLSTPSTSYCTQRFNLLAKETNRKAQPSPDETHCGQGAISRHCTRRWCSQVGGKAYASVVPSALGPALCIALTFVCIAGQLYNICSWWGPMGGWGAATDEGWGW